MRVSRRWCSCLWLSSWLLCAFVRPVRADPARPRIEVAFVLDATGSMGPYIDAARQKIGAIANDLQSGDPRPEVRFALVSFRDRGDEYVTRVRDFSPELARMPTGKKLVRPA
jgi:hypothetical protein